MASIAYCVIAKSFLKYYWHQICKYKIIQNNNLEKLPLIVKVIQGIFGKEYIPDKLESMDKAKIEQAENEISRQCFSEVIPRFQKLRDGSSRCVFYEYDTKNKTIMLKPEAMKYFSQNYFLLSKSVIYEWAKFLEKRNKGLPMLIWKIEREEPKRGPLDQIGEVLSVYFDKCFYCNMPFSQDKQVDHFIPWSYIYEDEPWNLVLSCRSCNRNKLDMLPPRHYLNSLFERNLTYSDKIDFLKKSLMKLDPEHEYKNAIIKYYNSCHEYGFRINENLKRR